MIIFFSACSVVVINFGAVQRPWKDLITDRKRGYFVFAQKIGRFSRISSTRQTYRMHSMQTRTHKKCYVKVIFSQSTRREYFSVLILSDCLDVVQSAICECFVNSVYASVLVRLPNNDRRSQTTTERKNTQIKRHTRHNKQTSKIQIKAEQTQRIKQASVCMWVQ